jgi:hypothetical protein
MAMHVSSSSSSSSSHSQAAPRETHNVRHLRAAESGGWSTDAGATTRCGATACEEGGCQKRLIHVGPLWHEATLAAVIPLKWRVTEGQGGAWIPAVALQGEQEVVAVGWGGED